ncbi:MAG: hypothetical protein QM679_11415 [Patulibacter sp.]
MLLPHAVLSIAIPLTLTGGTAAPAQTAQTAQTAQAARTATAAAAASTTRRCVGTTAVARAWRYARSRPGTVTFAVQQGTQIVSHGGGVPMRSASLVKAMLLVADLRRHASNGQPLSAADRARLAAMIRYSDNVQATATFNLVGRSDVLALAKAAQMKRYTVGFGWGTSQLTASDQVRFWSHLNGLLPAKYRLYGRRLLRTISSAQTWGGAPVARAHGFRTMFKSGWLPQPTGWVVHQGLRIERGSCTAGIAVLTRNQPSMAAGVTSIRGVVARLLAR